MASIFKSFFHLISSSKQCCKNAGDLQVFMKRLGKKKTWKRRKFQRLFRPKICLTHSEFWKILFQNFHRAQLLWESFLISSSRNRVFGLLRIFAKPNLEKSLKHSNTKLMCCPPSIHDQILEFIKKNSWQIKLNEEGNFCRSSVS